MPNFFHQSTQSGFQDISLDVSKVRLGGFTTSLENIGFESLKLEFLKNYGEKTVSGRLMKPCQLSLNIKDWSQKKN